MHRRLWAPANRARRRPLASRSRVPWSHHRSSPHISAINLHSCEYSPCFSTHSRLYPLMRSFVPQGSSRGYLRIRRTSQERYVICIITRRFSEPMLALASPDHSLPADTHPPALDRPSPHRRGHEEYSAVLPRLGHPCRQVSGNAATESLSAPHSHRFLTYSMSSLKREPVSV